MSNRIPKLCQHRRDGTAYVTLNGSQHYVGRWGTKEAEEAYAALIARWIANDRNPIDDPIGLVILELVSRYLRHAERYYLKAGEVTSEYSCVKGAMRPLTALYGHTGVDQFGPLDLKAVRTKMIQEKWSRGTVNGYVMRIRRMFRWGVENGLVAAATLEGLRAVAGLRKGRSEAREPQPVRAVEEAVIEKVAEAVRPPVAAMMRLQLLTAMRSQEVLVMTTVDINRDGDVWIFEPSRFKSEHFPGAERKIAIGPRAQALLRPWLKLDQDERLFDYTRFGYRRAIVRACARLGVEHFTPHQIRHTAATRIRAEMGLDASKCVLGHSSANTTGIYAELDMRKAIEAAKELG